MRNYFFKLIVSVFLFFYFGIAISQNNADKVRDLQILFEKLSFAPDDSERDSLNRKITTEIKNYISENDIKNIKVIKNVSVLVSDDDYLEIITWPILYSDNIYRFFGFIKYYDKDFGRYNVEFLADKSDKIINPEYQILTPNNWFGAFYYKLIQKKYKKEKVYVLLGWDGNNDLSNKKIIDVFYLDENNEPTFGKNIFESENGIKKRLIFEYKEGISMSLRYDEKSDKIIWDHLSPSKPELKGHYEYYGPDLTFDALKFEKGVWKYIPDYDITQK